MPSSQSLVLYTRQPLSTTTASTPSSLIARSLFTQQTGTAIATELLYRILLELLHRVLVGVQGFAAKRFDDLHSYLEKRAALRVDTDSGKEEEEREAGLKVVEEVGRLAGARGFVCPMTGRGMGGEEGWKGRRRGPPEWVRRRWEERMGSWVRNVGEGRVGSDIGVAGMAG